MAALPDITEAELAVLRRLWERGTQNRRQLTDALYPDGGPAHYTTVQKLLERLDAKGYVKSSMAQGVRQFTAAVGRDRVIRSRLRAMADELCDGSLAPILSHLVEAGPLTEAEIAELKALVRRLGR